MRTTILLSVIIFLLSTTTIQAQILPQTSTKDTSTFIVVEEMPEFPGGQDALKKYLEVNIIYPQKAHDKGISGKVSVKFIIDKTGKIKNVSVMKSVDKELDAEAKRVVKNMPAWIPGKQKGEPVNVQMVLPVNFKLDQ